MQFFAPESLVYLLLLPVLLILFVFSKSIWKKKVILIGNLVSLRSKLMPGHHPSLETLRLILRLAVLFFAVIALSKPQWGEEKKKIQRKGVDIIFMLDTSLSMLAEDIKPNRFEKSKLEIKSILEQLKGDRVGMIAFAGSSFLQSPLTLDYGAFLLFIDAIRVGYIPDPGTSLDKAIKLAVKSFPKDNMMHKAVILFSDGEDHQGGVEPALEEAKKAGLKIYTLGVGSPEGDPIPLKDEEGRKAGFKKDRSGQVVVTKLNKDLLEKIAADSGGLYLPSTPGEQEIEIILKHIEGMEKKQFKEALVTEKEDRFQLFLSFMLILFSFELLIPFRRVVK